LISLAAKAHLHPKNDFKQFASTSVSASASVETDNDRNVLGGNTVNSSTQGGFSPRKLSLASLAGDGKRRGSGGSMAAEVIAAAASGGNEDSGPRDKSAMKAQLEQLFSMKKK
jgi:hypothetical protein